ncbi:MAG: polyprenyl synthetase family protein [Rickettsiaceae bacterium]|nr:polyprenyl synthetase family protein [Rickettsiaceae bacterium]
MTLIKEIHQYLAEEITAINKLIESSLFTKENLIQKIGLYLANAGGKRMRPMLTLLTAKIFDYNGEHAIKLATSIEFIHMATLLHDDVVDGSTLRRFIPTANSLWGDKASILVGDFLFSQSFKLIVSTQNQRALEILSNSSSIISEGEVAQLSKLKEKKIITKDEYYKLIQAKTAELFSAACEVGAVVAGHNKEAEFFKEFGLQLGIAFQISDDSLDYFGKSDKLGKNLGDDFYEGKVTLPLIILSHKLSHEEHQQLVSMINSDIRTAKDFMWVKTQLENHQIMTLIQQELNLVKDKAIKSIKDLNLDDNLPLNYLIGLLNYSVDRINL